MTSIRVSITALLFLFNFCASAKEVTDTLHSDNNDRIIVTYSVARKGNKVDLEFKSVTKQLGGYHRDKYKNEANKVLTLFFDGLVVRKDIRISVEKTPSLICLPANASYKKSSDSYFVLEERPSLSFEVESSESASITIPLYLAYYEGKQRYKVLCSCGDLEVRIPPTSTSSSIAQPAIKKSSQQSSDEFVEIEEEFDELNEQALNLIKGIDKDLPRQDKLPMESTLERKIENLVDLQAKIKNEDIIKKIDETLEAYNSKKKELEKELAKVEEQKADNDAFNSCTTKEQYESYLKQHPYGSHVDDANAAITKINNEAQEKKDKERKRNIWMIVGGALLAILLFVGNQVMQSFRNIRTQRSMMQMQQDAAKRAQNMARGKVQNEIRKQTNKVTGQVRKKSQTIIRDTANKAKNNKGNNRVSI